jgi:hypothetical protein
MVQTGGTGYDVRHPDQVVVGLTYTSIRVYGPQSQDFPERLITLDLLHIMRREPPAQPP